MKHFKKRLVISTFILLNIISLITWMAPNIARADSPTTNTDSLVQTEALTQRFQKMLPKGWKLTVNVNATPFRFKTTGITGVKVKFQSASKVFPVGRPTGMGQPEGFTLWVMPIEFTPERQTNESEKVGGSFSGSPLCLGSNKTFKVFYLSASVSTPTWLTWQRDVRRILELPETGTETNIKQSHQVECQNISNCVFLGTTGEPNDRVYQIRMSEEDRKTFFLRSGDSLGKYIISGASVGGDELVLTNGLERITIKKQGKQRNPGQESDIIGIIGVKPKDNR